MNIIISIFKTFIICLMIIANTHFAYSQTASILPPAKTQLLDNNGNPLVSGTVDYYVPGTTTRKTTWRDSGQTVANTNPVVLDGGGRALMLGDGSYRQVVKDRLGNLIWDQITSSTGTGGGGTTATVGDGQPVGSIQTWAGMVAPQAYVFAYGQEFTRIGFPELFSALTSLQNISCTLGSSTLSGISNTEQLPIGAKIESVCLNSGSTVVSKTISTVVASSNAIITTSTSARFFPYGNGDGSATFNAPDLRGQIVTGRCNMGGLTCSLSSTYWLSNPNAVGAKGGLQNHTLSLAELPTGITALNANAFSVASTSSRSDFIFNTLGLASTSAGLGGANSLLTSTAGGISAVTSNASVAIGQIGTTSNNTSGNPHSIIPPTTTLNYVIKILPDTNPNSYFGVASIGGMTGVILCGFGLTCAGNTISSINSLVPPPTPIILGGVFQSNAPASQFAIGVDLAGNILYGGGSTTVNGQVCAIGSSCTIVASAGSITVGSTLVASGSTNALLFNNAGTLGNITTANNSILGTNGSGVPSWITTIPSAVLNSSLTSVGTLTGGATGAGFNINFTTSTKTGVVPLVNGGSSQTTALLARSSSGFNIDQATSTGDANYTILSTDRMVYHTSLTAARTDTLPAANSINAGQQFIINDFSGSASASNTVTLQRSGSDTINGINSLVAINAQYGAGIFWSDGISKWTFFPQSTGGGSGTVTNIATSGIVTGGPITTSGTIGINATIISQLRLTLLSGVPVMVSSVPAASNIFLTPDDGNLISLFNGTNFTPTALSELTLSLGSAYTASSLIDLFVGLDGVTPRLCAGPTYVSSTMGAANRGTGAGTTELIRVNGINLNANTLATCRYNNTTTFSCAAQRCTYVGTTFLNAAKTVDMIFGGSGSGGVAGFFGLWNAYNRNSAVANVIDNGVSYTYSSGVRQARGSANNQASYVIGIPQDTVFVNYSTRIDTTAVSGAFGFIGIGDNITTNFSTQRVFSRTVANVVMINSPYLSITKIPLLGLSLFAAIESSDGTNSNSFDADSFGTLSLNVMN